MSENKDPGMFKDFAAVVFGVVMASLGVVVAAFVIGLVAHWAYRAALIGWGLAG